MDLLRAAHRRGPLDTIRIFQTAGVECMRHWIVLLFCGLIAFSVRAAAEPNAEGATSLAFDALLSFEGATPPDSEWQHSAPEGFDPQSEEDLVAYLARQKATGADFRAIRHQGTLLHHALRAGLEYTAQWLLDQGADPLQVRYGKHDALVMAIEYRRWYVVKQLLTIPKVRARHARDESLSAWRAVDSTKGGGHDERDAVVRLLKFRLPIPKGASGETLLARAVERHWLPLVIALNDAGVSRAKNLSCGVVIGAPPGGWRRGELERADRRLETPLMLNLLNFVSDVATLDQLFAMSLRQPWGDVAFARRVIDCTLRPYMQSAVQRAIFERIGDEALAAALATDDLAARWGSWLLEQPESTARWAIKRVIDQPGGIVRVARLAVTTQSTRGTAWPVLLEYLPSPRPEALNVPLLDRVPAEAHRLLLARGYRPEDWELTRLFNPELKLTYWSYPDHPAEPDPLWPALVEARPDLKQRYPEIVFALKLGEWARSCGERFPLAAVDWFQAAGYRQVRPVQIDVECWPRLPTEQQSRLIELGVLVAPPAASPGRFIPAERTCRINASPSLRRALVNLPQGLTEVLPMDVPGTPECGLLLQFDSSETGIDTADESDDFEGGRQGRQSSCAGPPERLVGVLLDPNGTMSSPVFEEDGMSEVRPIHDVLHGRRYFVVRSRFSQCDQFPAPMMLGWDDSAAVPKVEIARLTVIPRESEVMQSWLASCRMESGEHCDDAWRFLPTEDRANNNATVFFDRLFAAERAAFIEAVLGGDRDRLDRELAAGVFPHWISAAMAAVETADLPAEKKKRLTELVLRSRRHGVSETSRHLPTD